MLASRRGLLQSCEMTADNLEAYALCRANGENRWDGSVALFQQTAGDHLCLDFCRALENIENPGIAQHA